MDNGPDDGPRAAEPGATTCLTFDVTNEIVVQSFYQIRPSVHRTAWRGQDQHRIAKTTNPRHLLMLQRLLKHAVGESRPDLDLVMSTLSADPRIWPGALLPT